jgi:Domain of unknown function (DUF2431)
MATNFANHGRNPPHKRDFKKWYRHHGISNRVSMVSHCKFTWKTVMSIFTLCGQSAVSRALLSTSRCLFFSRSMTTTTTTTLPVEHALTGGAPKVVLSSNYSTQEEGQPEKQEEKDLSSSGQQLKAWLVVGDGDLSYSASIAERLALSNTRLIATVWENQELHHRIYQNSQEHSEAISSHSSNHAVHFGIDATQLQSHFPGAKFDVIEFNFPHWRGKNNNKHNRALLDDFFKSASTMLQPPVVTKSDNDNSIDDDTNGGGEIRIALAEGQGGIPVSVSSSLVEWKQSWMAPMYAAEHQLLLSRAESYEPEYCLSSHRGVDRPFRIGDAPQRYIFRFANGESVDPELQLSCRHELRIMLHPERFVVRKDDDHILPSPSQEEILHGTAVADLVQEFLPPGICLDIPARQLLQPNETNQDHEQHVPLAVFLLTYSGESVPLTRDQSDRIRANVEAAIVEKWKLDVAKGGRLVSRVYPRRLTRQIIKEY